ncbi:MAG: hypothetical protein ACIARR_06470 [Phycisphaerales bacterium JB059]
MRQQTNIRRILALAAAATATTPFLLAAGCDDSDAEDAVEEVGDSVEDTAEDVGDAVDDLVDD